MVSAHAADKTTGDSILQKFSHVETEEGRAYNRYHNLQTHEDGLVKVDAVGFGFTLMHRKVLEGIEPPYFRFVGNEGEDSYFSEKASRAGFEFFVDTRVTIGHLGQPTVTHPRGK